MRERKGKQQYDFRKKKASGEKAPVGKIKSQPCLYCRIPPKNVGTGNTEYSSENGGELGTKIKLLESLWSSWTPRCMFGG